MDNRFFSDTVFVAVFAVLLLGLLWSFYRVLSSRPRYKRINTLFTPAEQRFLHHLIKAIPPELLVFGKVRVADVLQPRSSFSKRSWLRQFWKISSKHLDFVLVERDSTQIFCAIELDDRSHLRPDRLQRDHFLNAACESAGLPLLRWPVQSSYDEAEIRRRIADALTPSNDADAPVGNDTRSSSGAIRHATPHSHAVCPKCASPLVQRANRLTGDHFLGCVRYPECRYTRSL